MSGDVHGVLLSNISEKKFIKSSGRSPADGEENELQNVQAERFQKPIPHPDTGAQDIGSLCASHWRVSGHKTETYGNRRDFRGGESETLSSEPQYSPPYCVDSNNTCCSDVKPSFSGTSSYFKWAENFQCLLQDLDGVNLFKKYLSQEKCADCLDFWFACEGLKKANPTDKNYIQQVIKLIYKKFIRSRLVEIKSEIKEEIASKIGNKMGLDQTIFDNAQKNIEDIMTRTTYPNFLKSELYLEQIQLVQQSSHLKLTKQVESSMFDSSSGTSRQGLDILPTLHEESQLHVGQSQQPVSFIRETLKKRPRLIENVPRYRPEAQAGHYLHVSSKIPNPYHVKYATVLPTSAQDSELQSLSSDAQTDDTMSLTDGSTVDCGPNLSSRTQLKRHQRAVKKNASFNKDHQAIIPRTQRPPKEFTSPVSQQEFAEILIQKLLKLKNERETQEKIEDSLKKLEIVEEKATLLSSVSHSVGRFAGIPPQLLTATIKEKQEVTEENDQSILDQHVSRVWNDSSHHTPNRSPNQFSPHPRPGTAGVSGFSPFMSNPSVSSGGVYSSPYQSVSSHSSLAPQIKERQICSSDSGTVHNFSSNYETTKFSPYYEHRHLHHHHAEMGTSLELGRGCGEPPEQFIMSQTDHQQTRRSKETSRKSGSKKLSGTDSGRSCIDSVTCDPTQPCSERVYHWMMENEKYSSHARGPDSEKDSSMRHKKPSRSHFSTPAPCRQGHSKKPLAYNTSRSGSLEIGVSIPWPHSLHSSSSGMCPKSHPFSCELHPTQPIALDLSMPILPPPDTDTQLLEAKRRLEDVKSSKTSMRKLSKNTLPVLHAHSSQTADITVIGYCFSGESVPYRTKLPGKNITLKQFKALVSKKGNYRYFFKKECNEFGTGVINEEVSDDSEVLPLWDGKIFATIESVD
ncbi:axin-1-like [Limulus polyphemus]|uniref:Axin-1-like n=1 Tax=Limulus polyphemus TaxID=6850 RepID=A0ABM1BZT8_LIMPO|nr:axin-1-like [Limulus polyphemus]